MWNASQKKQFISKFGEKSTRRMLYKDNRRLNTAKNRKYSGRKYISKIINKSVYKKVFKEVRMFYVAKRNANTLLPIIQKNLLPGTTIISDEWRAYNTLGQLGYTHFTVNHSENFVNPVTNQHTQIIECLWGHAKFKIMRAMRGTTEQNLQGHLAEFWYRSTLEKKGKLVFRDILFQLKSFSKMNFSVENINEENHFISKLNGVFNDNFAQFREIFNMKNCELEQRLKECEDALIFFRKFSSFQPSNVNERKFLLYLAAVYNTLD